MRVLMCPPEYYGIYYEINPWMSQANPADRDLALRQWQALYDLYQRLGVVVDLLNPVEGLPDMVFTANAGLIEDKRCVLANFRHSERKGEEEHFRRWFQENGFEVLELAPSQLFEGAGDAKFFHTVLYAGFHFRSDIRSHVRIGEWLRRRVVSLELVNSRLYHLDTCFAPLGERCVMYYPPAFANYSQRTINHFAKALLPVGEQDALDFACNCVAIGDQIVLNRCSTELRDELKKYGFQVHEVDVSQFMKAGGSTGCLTLVLEA